MGADAHGSHGSSIPGWAIGGALVAAGLVGVMWAYGTFIDPKSPRAAADTSSLLVGGAQAGHAQPLGPPQPINGGQPFAPQLGGNGKVNLPQATQGYHWEQPAAPQSATISGCAGNSGAFVSVGGDLYRCR